MLNLYIFNETLTNGLSYNLLTFITWMSVLCGIFVIVSKNPIVSVLFLIGLFLNIAGYLMMLGINFIGLSYLLVYVGAVSILFLFILMLINVRISELVTDSSNSIPLAITIGIFFNITLYKLLPSNASEIYNLYDYGVNSNFSSSLSVEGKNSLIQGLDTGNDAMNISSNLYPIKSFFYSGQWAYDSNNVLFVSSQIWDGALAETSHITSIGNIIYTSYPLWLIITSIILLLAMVGAIVITIKK